MLTDTLFLIGTCPPPDWILEAIEEARNAPGGGSVAVLFMGEGVYNSKDRFPDALVLARDAIGRGVSPGDRALTDHEAARWVLNARRVITST
jgi:hypothetical protein